MEVKVVVRFLAMLYIVSGRWSRAPLQTIPSRPAQQGLVRVIVQKNPKGPKIEKFQSRLKF